MSNPQHLAAFIGRPMSLLRRRPPAAWITLLGATPFLAGFYLLLPETGLTRTIAYPFFGIVGMIAILIGIHQRPSARPGSWRLIALAFGLLSLGDVTYTLLHIGGEGPYPSAADIAYLAGYVALILGIVGLIRGRVPGGDRTPIIDAAILAVGAASIFWVVIVRPSIQGVVDPSVALVSMAYPVLDLVLLALGLRVLLSAAARPKYLQLLIAGIALYFVADVIYAVAVLNGTYVDGEPLDAVWIIGVMLVGVAALHPSVGDTIAAPKVRETTLSRPRLVMLAAAALIAPVILIIHEFDAHDDVVVGLVVEWTILFALVLLRLATTVDALAESLQARRRLQGDLAYQAHHDPLTRLANRLLFEVRLKEALATAPDSTALIFLDLDDFKAINDTLGHPTGDEVLRVVAGRLQRALRGSDLAVRLGGDEFAILVEDCETPAAACVVAERALASLRGPVVVGDRQLSVHASAGIALGQSGSSPQDLMRDADIAMYEAKSHGKDQIEMFETAMRTQVIRSYELRTDLVEAIETQAFVLHYQPAFQIDGGAIVGAEALVRWNHPERGLLGPAEFIPEAEASGLIHSLGRWILREACATAAAWPARADGQRPAISVNLAASQLLRPGLVDEVVEILAETGLPPNKLILEVTESALVDLELARVALVGLRDIGVLLALDDFGTGYSALSYLAKLPFDIVKIDRSFITSIGHGRRVDALLDGIIGLCDALELVTVAEGIERQPELDRLAKLGCRIGQGYLFARPMPGPLFAAMLAAGSAGRPAPSRRARLSTLNRLGISVAS